MTNLILDIIGRDHASHAFKSVGKEVEGAGSKISKFKIGAAAGFAVVGLAAFELAKKSVDAFQNTATAALTLQRVIGGTAEGASRLNFAAEETGVSQEKLGLGIKALSTHLSANDKAWKMTGLSVKGANGQLLTTTQALPELADIFAKMPAGAQKSALAVKLFGKSGLTLLPFLNQGSSGLAKLNEESDKLGHTLSGPQLAAVHANIVAHREFSAAVSGVEIQIGAALYPALARIIPKVAEFASTVAAKAIPVIQEFGRWFAGKLLPALDKAYQQIMPGVERAFAAVGKSLNNGKGGWSGIGNAIIRFIAVASKVISVVLPVMIRLWGVQLVVYQQTYHAIVILGKAASSVFHGMVSVASWMWSKLSPIFRALTSAFNAAKAAASFAANIVGSGGPSTSGMHKPGRAAGGPVQAGFAYRVNELGQETFIPSVNGTIRPAGQAGGGGDMTHSAPIILKLDSRTVWQGLVVFKRQGGISSLGLA